MKRTCLILIAVLSAFQFTYAQWATSGSNIYNTNTGYVGIGTSSPAYPLDVQINTNSTTGVQFTNASTGTSARSRFTLSNGINYASLNLNGSTYPTDPNALEIFAPSSGGALIFGAGGSQWMRLTQNGNVLIGKSSQVNTSYILDVAGNARANEVVVNTTGADFVFDPTYKLPSLSSLERYIENNHHLPQIASAKEMQADGLNLGDNQTKLLQKVEELTLYLIEKDKQLNEQQKINQSFQQQLNVLTEQLKALKPAVKTN
jgi:hypothetical protein